MRAYLCNILSWIEHFLTSKWPYQPKEKKSSKPSFAIAKQDVFLNRSIEHKKRKTQKPQHVFFTGKDQYVFVNKKAKTFTN